jgi:hypothetical protein
MYSIYTIGSWAPWLIPHNCYHKQKTSTLLLRVQRNSINDHARMAGENQDWFGQAGIYGYPVITISSEKS